MTFADALRASVRPAVLVGPALGLAAGLVLLVILLWSAGSYEGVPIVAAISLVAALVLGLFVGGPVCLVGSALMLKAACADRRWAGQGRWIGAGFALGAVVGALFGLATADPTGMAVWAAIIAVIGTFGGWLCRRVLQKTIGELDVIDPEVFA